MLARDGAHKSRFLEGQGGNFCPTQETIHVAGQKLLERLGACGFACYWGLPEVARLARLGRPHLGPLERAWIHSNLRTVSKQPQNTPK
ncbi:hypothetical protein GCM10009585_04940 [Brevibacterium paucivorans]